MQVTPFVQRINNFVLGKAIEVIPMTIGASGVKQHVNLAWAKLSGFDLMLLARPTPGLQLISTTKYTYGETAEDDPLPMVPPLKTVTSLRFDQRNINVQLEWEFALPQRRVNPASLEQTTARWSVFALRTGWKINSFLQCNGGVENILNETYREHLDWGGIPRAGRNLYLNVQYKF